MIIAAVAGANGCVIVAGNERDFAGLQIVKPLKEANRTANGHAALSPEMALRIEKAFGVDMDMLLRMQAWHDGHTMRQRASEIQVKRYEPGRPKTHLTNSPNIYLTNGSRPAMLWA